MRFPCDSSFTRDGEAPRIAWIGQREPVDVQGAMTLGAARYSSALEVLGRYGKAEFTQTGGMCAALQVTLERGVLLVTDVDDSLPWNAEELRGWGVGFYWSDDFCEGPESFVDADNVDPATLASLVERCLRELGPTLALGRDRAGVRGGHRSEAG